MDTLESMRAFARVVELGGFAPAARNLDLSPAMIAKHVAHLENRTGARLLNRTTRHVRPTDVGQAYYERCLEILAGVDDAENAAAAALTQPRGTLRLTAPVEFGNAHLAAIVAQFLDRHADAAVSLDFSNRIVNLVEEGFDLAIRVSASLDTSLIGRKLATSRFHVVASPAYLKAHGRPKAPQDLRSHRCLNFAVPTPLETWRFAKAGRAVQVNVTSRLLSTSSEALRVAANAGAGVSILPTFICGEDLLSRKLVSLFPGHDLGALGVYAIYPHRRYLPAKVRLFLDFLIERFGNDPDRDPWAAGRR